MSSAENKEEVEETISKEPASSASKSWSAFLQNSSFHGMRYIVVDPGTGKVSVTFRGLIWMLLVILSMGAFAYQVSERVGAYLRFDSRVGMEVVYEDKVPFPAVTICNQNQIRLTKIVELGKYSLVNNILSYEREATEDQEVINMDTEKFLETVAHQKEDLIESCTWAGKPRNSSEVFTARFTDMGVCYTFNMRGTTFGLSLMLNVEQYEHLPEAKTDTGIKISLHDQDEDPLMTELGFSVPPGKHSILALKRTEMYNMHPPVGKCHSDAAPYSNCQLQCKAEDSADLCKCLDPRHHLIQNYEGLDVCSPTEALTCGKKLRGSFQSNHTCLCDITCRQVDYDLMASFSSLSNYNMEEFILENPAKTESLRQRLLDAKETAQKVSETIVKADTQLMGGSLDAMLALKELLNYTNENIISTESFFVKTPNGSVDVLDRVHRLIETDVLTLNSARRALNGGTYFTGYGEDGLKKWFRYVRQMVLLHKRRSDSNGTFLSIDKLQKCVNNSDGSINVTVTFKECYVPEYTNVWKDPLRSIESAKERIPSIRESMDDNFRRYGEILDFISPAIPIPEQYTPHNECMHGLETLNQSVDITAENLMKLFKNDTPAVETIERLELLVEAGRDYHKDKIVTITVERCKWYFESIYRPDSGVSSPSLKDLYLTWSDFYTTLSDTLFTLYSQLSGFQSDYNKHFSFFHNPLEKYQNGSSKKIEFTDEMGTRSVRRSLVELKKTTKALEQHVSQFALVYSDDFSVFINQMYSDSFNTTIPLFSHELMNNLKMVQELFEVEVEQRTLDSIANLLETDPASGMEALVKTILGFYGWLMEEILQHVLSLTHRVIDHLESLFDKLEKYKKETKVDSKFFRDNFLQVDIYYPELKYDVVTQQMALEFIALLSEVGGLMGLLLGASVLTVCELADHAARHMWARVCTKRGKETNENEEGNGKHLDATARI